MLSILYIFAFYGYVLACPPKEAIAPCDCKTIFNTDILNCEGLLNPDELMKPIAAVAEDRYNLLNILAIVNSSFLYIPHSAFKFSKFEKIHLINSGIMSLSDTDVAFEGLENSLTELRATEAHYVAEWDWKQLRNLNALRLIEVKNIQLGSISVPFPDLKNLKFLGIIRSNIDFIIDYAFADLKEITFLNLKGNDISELKRNMFPEPAYNLVSIDFSENELSHLPQDIFRNMPSLAQVSLDYNKFTTLDRKIFTWALKNLSGLTMFGRKFVCDCRLKWMAGGQVPVEFTGNCDSPSSLSGKPLRKLELAELKC